MQVLKLQFVFEARNWKNKGRCAFNEFNNNHFCSESRKIPDYAVIITSLPLYVLDGTHIYNL